MKNKIDNFNQQISDFKKNRIYPIEAINLVESYQGQLISVSNLWDNALGKIVSTFNLKESNKKSIPYQLQEFTLSQTNKKFKEMSESDIRIIGIAGPGACGKGVLVESLSLPKVVNTTTRPPRSYEIDKLHYHFVDDSNFQNMIKAGEFLSTTNRPDRGWYGIEKTALNNLFKSSKVVIIEENPDTLFKVHNSIITEFDKQIYFAINYIIPPQPIILHLATRLAKRCLESNSNFLDSINSTLGSRQVAEFESLVNIAKNGGNICFWVVDNNIDQVACSIKKIYKIK